VSRILFVGTNSTIPRDAFQSEGRGLAFNGNRGGSTTSQKAMHCIESKSGPVRRADSRAVY
jgi:hypothetical protein